MSEQEDKNKSRLEDVMSKRRKEEEIHQANLEEAKRNVERRVKSEVKQKLEAESENILRRIEEEHNQRFLQSKNFYFIFIDVIGIPT